MASRIGDSAVELTRRGFVCGAGGAASALWQPWRFPFGAALGAGGAPPGSLPALLIPALAAICPHCSTDDRSTADGHYLGGCMVQGMFVWGFYWAGFSPRPPDPAVVGSRWRAMWKERLASLDF